MLHGRNYVHFHSIYIECCSSKLIQDYDNLRIILPLWIILQHLPSLNTRNPSTRCYRIAQSQFEKALLVEKT